MKEVFIVPKWVGFAFLLVIGGICTSAYFPLNFNSGNGILVTRTGNEVNFEDSTRYITGWANYRDATHTSASPQLIAQGVTDTLENTADSVNQQYPIGVTSFYNGISKKITPARVGDAYNLTIRFKARNSSNTGYFSIQITINGPGSTILEETRSFRKGADNEQWFTLGFNVYTLQTFVTNGGTIKITANEGDLEIYDIQYLITRIHRGR